MFKRIFTSAVVITLFFAWFFAGWPTLWSTHPLPLQPQKADAFTTTFTSSGSWQAPAGVSEVTVEAWGGGGAGGGRATTGVSGGGGGGAYAKKVITVTPLSTYDYTVGAGGVGISGNGPDGGATQWEDGSELKAAGGEGGLSLTTKGLGGANADSVGTTLFNGGDGADGAGAVGGGGGGGAGSTDAGNNASGRTGGAGQTQDGGAGGNGGSNSNGVIGSLYGAGGGGAHRSSGTRLGGNGAAGALRISYSSTSTVSMQSGYYIGDGTSSHAITGLGFAPDFVLVKADTTAGVAAFKTRIMPAANTAFVTAAADNTASLLVLDSDGFTLGSNASVNSANVRYTWIAFAGSDCSSTGSFCVGQYTGTGSTTRALNTGFQPNFVMIKRTTAVAAHFHTSSQPDNETLYMMNTLRDTTGNFMKSFNAAGFTVGATDNAAAGVYNYIAFKNTANVFAEGTYNGDGADNRDIEGVGFQPDAVLVKNATNATTTNVIPALNTLSSYGDYTTLLIAAANVVNYVQSLISDGFQVGTNVTVNGAGDTYYWLAFKGAPATSSTGSFEIATGTYTGNGTAQTITDLGFRPDLVIIKDNSTNYQVFRTSLMKGDSTAYLSAATANFATGITSLTSDGFSVGASTIVNTNSNTYQYQAFGNAWSPETESGSSDFAIGAYMGNGLDSRNITGLPWQPNMVAVKRNSTSAGVWRSSELIGDLSSFFGATAETADYIQALNSDGFQVGTNAVVNGAGSLLFWFAFKSGTGFTTGSYTGNSSDNRNITGLGLQPSLVWVKRSTNANGISRADTTIGDSTQYFANLANVADRIQSLISDGFQVGGNTAEANANTGTYRYAAWGTPVEPIVSVSVSDGVVSYGLMPMNTSKSTLASDLNDTQVVTNDGNVATDINIKGQDSAAWNLGVTPGSNQYVHKYSINAGTDWFALTSGYQLLLSNLAADGTQSVDLRLTTPTSSSSYNQQSVDVTIQAVQH